MAVRARCVEQAGRVEEARTLKEQLRTRADVDPFLWSIIAARRIAEGWAAQGTP